MKKRCHQCRRIFQKPSTCSRSDWMNERKFCSKWCYTLAMKGKPFPNRYIGPAPCKGRTFPQFSGSRNRNWKGGKSTFKCLECGLGFEVRPYRRQIAKFCSHKCSTNYRNTGKTPVNKNARHVAAYKAWRTLVFERDDYTCQACGVRGVYLHAHHIKYFAHHPRLRYTVSNGETLCVPCHKKAHQFKICLAVDQEP